jgi:hypothetical protein
LKTNKALFSSLRMDQESQVGHPTRTPFEPKSFTIHSATGKSHEH